MAGRKGILSERWKGIGHRSIDQSSRASVKLVGLKLSGKISGRNHCETGKTEIDTKNQTVKTCAKVTQNERDVKVVAER